jgi:hypothetical protein
MLLINIEVWEILLHFIKYCRAANVVNLLLSEWENNVDGKLCIFLLVYNQFYQTDKEKELFSLKGQAKAR